MYFAEIDSIIRKETPNEKWHKENPGKLSRLYSNDRYIRKMADNLYYFNFTPDFALNNLMVLKESRYTELYPNYHDYMEICFIYSGKAVYQVNNREIILNDGDILLIQKGIIHSTGYRDENDIILNIEFKDELFSLDFLNSFSKNQQIYQFLVGNFFKIKKSDGYIIIRNDNNRLLNMVIESICTLYYKEHKVNYEDIMDDYFRVLFHLLFNAVTEQENSEFMEEMDEIIYKVLNYINVNYRTCSLEDIADSMGYNYNYLSNLIKKKIGKSFSKIKLEYQLNMAYKLINGTEMAIYEICESCGIINQTYFYKKFYENYGVSPNKLRNKKE
ncbi:AraC family transcriptional regulator [Lacrimispora sp.]|uniref:AraC family transcriptional regulator n=1 Tax=Lacrimispora sp. TaxID=2719234 RepID=UPI0028A1AB8E|nr:AraC family transcriptional regulator [Lacrimispora sp.]